MGEIYKKWDLNSLFSSDDDYQEFREFLINLEHDYIFFGNQLDSFDSPEIISTYNFSEILNTKQELVGRLGVANGFINCLNQDGNSEYKTIFTRLLSLNLRVSSFINYFIGEIPEEKWSTFITDNLLKSISFPLQKRRHISRGLTSPHMTNAINSFSPIGLYSWEDLYSTLIKKINNEIIKGNLKIENHFEFREKKLVENQDLFASILNNLTGFRLSIYQFSGKDSFLSEALFNINNMSESTLKKMWEIIELNLDSLHKYLELKANILNTDQLSWKELNSSETSNFDQLEIINFVVDGISTFSPEFKKFIQTCIQNKWIQVEDNDSKKRGAFSLNFASKKQSRIYINVPNDISLITTLAHEIGHAYHFHTLHQLPVFSQNYSLSMAETIAMFSELIVTDWLITKQPNIKNTMSYIKLKNENNIGFLLDIYYKYLFESELYEKRQNKILSSSELNELMLSSQKKAFGDKLKNYNPTAWCSNSHFYKTQVPFYNFPYAFGCLFSNFLFQKYKNEPVNFVENFEEILKDTGTMTVENLVLKHFNLDLQESYFWQEAIDYMISDIEQLEYILKSDNLQGK